MDDNDLIELTRRSDGEAYAVLYDRYVYAARRLARHLGQREESDDVVSESFAQVLDLLRRGKGPDRAFRAYLFTTIRHECGRRANANKRVMPTDDQSQIDSTVPFGGGDLDEFEKSAIRAAYESLPSRWRTVLWHLDVEGRKPHELGPLLGLKANSVSALVYRARSGLRDAYLQQHVKTGEQPDRRPCRDVRDLLGTVVRRTSGKRDQEKVHAHLSTCPDCMAVYLDLQEVNREVGTIVTSTALAAAIGGGGLVVAVHSGGAILANLFAASKGIALALTAPAAAVALTSSGAVTVPEPSPDARADHSTSVARASDPGRAPSPTRRADADRRPDPAAAVTPAGGRTRTAEEGAKPAPVQAAKPAPVQAEVAPEGPAPVAGTGAVVDAGTVLAPVVEVEKRLRDAAPVTAGLLDTVTDGLLSSRPR